MSSSAIKDKIAIVRDVVEKTKKYSNDQIVLVLQHFDLDEKLTTAAFLDGQSDAILTEWHHAGPVKSKNAKKRKQKALRRKSKEAGGNPVVAAEALVSPLNGHDNSNVQEKLHENEFSKLEEDGNGNLATIIECKPINLPANHEVNGEPNLQTTAMTTDNALKAMLTKSLPNCGEEAVHNSKTMLVANLDVNTGERTVTSPPSDNVISVVSQNSKAQDEGNEKYTNKLYNGIVQESNRSRTTSEGSHHSSHRRKQKGVTSHQTHNYDGNHQVNAPTSNQVESSSSIALSNKKGIEKAARDLQRCSVSFGRYRVLLNDEINNSYKRIKQAFEDISNLLMDREVELIRKLDEMKEEAFGLLQKREQRAAELRRQTDMVAEMKQHELNELRSEIKHFVSERKYDEELGRTTRFVFDRDVFAKLIPKFGEISAVKNSYSARSRTNTESSQAAADHPKPEHSKPPTHAPPPTAVRKSPPKKLAVTGGQTGDENETPRDHVGKIWRAPSRRTATSGEGNNSAPVEDAVDDLKLDKLTVSEKPRDDDDAGDKFLSDGSATDWADAADITPVPQSPASWASDTPIIFTEQTPTKSNKSNNDIDRHRDNSRGSRDRRRNHSNQRSKMTAHSSLSNSKDIELMPPPKHIPTNSNNSRRADSNSNHHQQYNEQQQHNSQHGPDGDAPEYSATQPPQQQRNFASRNYRGEYRGGRYRGSGGYRGGRGRGGFNRGGRGGGYNNQHFRNHHDDDYRRNDERRFNGYQQRAPSPSVGGHKREGHRSKSDASN